MPDIKQDLTRYPISIKRDFSQSHNLHLSIDHGGYFITSKNRRSYHKYLACLILLLSLFSLTSCIDTSRGDKREGGSTEPKSTEAPLIYNFYIENSGSMSGYCNSKEINALETLVGDYYDRIDGSLDNNRGDTITLNFINTKIVQSRDFKDNFLASIKSHCNAPYTKIDQMLDSMMSNAKENEVNILISDYVFSTDIGNPATASSSITALFSKQLKNKKNFAVAMFKHMVDFNGKYYPGGILCSKPLPLYVWVFGNDTVVKKISQLAFNSKNCGEFFLQKSEPVDFTIEAENKRMINGHSIDVAKWKPKRNQDYYEISINADFSNIMLREESILDKSKYRIDASGSPTFELVDITKQRDDIYRLTLRTPRPAPSKLIISYPISAPAWVDDSNFSGTGLPIDSTTLNIKYLIDGVSKAFTSSSNNTNYFTIIVELK